MILRAESSNSFLFGFVCLDYNLLSGFLFSFINCLDCVVESYYFKNISYLLETCELSTFFSFDNCNEKTFKKFYSINIDQAQLASKF